VKQTIVMSKELSWERPTTRSLSSSLIILPNLE
jgi:hypothetical protein